MPPEHDETMGRPDDQLVPREVFDEDAYDYFYEGALTAERSDREAELIKRLCRLEAGADVLDVPCGDGRIALRLAGMGCKVVGVDQSERFVARAQKRARDASASFEVGDMRELAYAGDFDCVINWFTSFGYFDSKTNAEVLGAFHRALRPGGRLILDQISPRFIRRVVEVGGGSSAHIVDRGDDLLADRTTVDGDRSRTERWIVRDGQVRKFEFSLELLDEQVLAERLRTVGFRSFEFFDERGEAFGDGSRRIVAVATA